MSRQCSMLEWADALHSYVGGMSSSLDNLIHMCEFEMDGKDGRPALPNMVRHEIKDARRWQRKCKQRALLCLNHLRKLIDDAHFITPSELRRLYKRKV